jgi:hypothetical protein
MTQGCPGVYSRVNRDGLPTFETAQMLARSADTSQVIKAFALRCVTELNSLPSAGKPPPCGAYSLGKNIYFGGLSFDVLFMRGF